MFKNLKIEAWRQFEKIDIDFHPKLTLLSGANGAGKSTLLNLINRHFGWGNSFIGTPKSDKKTGALKFISDFWRVFKEEKDNTAPQNVVGSILYNNNLASNITVPQEVGASYAIHMDKQQHVEGLHIPSHRPVFRYQAIQNIPTIVPSKETYYNNYKNVSMQRYNGSNSAHAQNYYLKETLISLATFGYGNEAVVRNDVAVNLFEGFENILKVVLPSKLGFQSISVRIPEVVLVTASGEFSLDAVSGGVASIIDLAWQIFMFDKGEEFVITIDEPENHLHPEMQKTLLPNFLSAFPKTQFIIATHSPFIIGSVPDSNVYVLNYSKDNKVESILLEEVEKSGTANDILRDVLGLETTMPKWVDNKIDEIVAKYSDSGITLENVQNFKNDLKEVGLEKYASESVASLIESSKKNG